MNEQTKRIENLVEQRGIKMPDFLKTIGVSGQNWNNWEKRGVPHKRIVELAERFSVDANWLDSGVENKTIDAERFLECIKGEVDTSEKLNNVEINFLITAYGLVKKHVSLLDIEALSRMMVNIDSNYPPASHA